MPSFTEKNDLTLHSLFAGDENEKLIDFKVRNKREEFTNSKFFSNDTRKAIFHVNLLENTRNDVYLDGKLVGHRDAQGRLVFVVCECCGRRLTELEIFRHETLCPQCKYDLIKYADNGLELP